MKLFWVLIRLAGTLLLIIGGMQSGSRSVKAFEPKMDYWFIETLSVGNVELPAGVIIHASDPAAQPRASLTLENQSETLLFVLSLSYKNVLVMVTPDPNWNARVNVSHEVASYLVAPDRPAYLSMEALTDLDNNLADRNVLNSAPPPTGESVPAAQKSELLLVYGGQVIQEPFTITYALNTNFDNGSEASLQATVNASLTATQQAEASAVRMASNNTLVVGLLGAAVLLIAGWLVWRQLAHRK